MYTIFCLNYRRPCVPQMTMLNLLVHHGESGVVDAAVERTRTSIPRLPFVRFVCRRDPVHHFRASVRARSQSTAPEGSTSPQENQEAQSNWPSIHKWARRVCEWTYHDARSSIGVDIVFFICPSFFVSNVEVCSMFQF